MFILLSVEDYGLCWLRLGALLRVMFKVWSPLVLKIYLSKIFYGKSLLVF